MNNIVLTGGTGFIGRELIKKLPKKKVYIIGKKKIKVLKNHKSIVCDLKDKKILTRILKKINPRIVYHFAWEGIPNFNRKNFERNIKISKNLIFALNNTNCKKIIISGSGAEYGVTNKKCYEYHNPNKKITYLGRQKNFIRKLFFKNLEKGISIIWCRIFYVYGYNQRNESLLKSLINSLKFDKKFKIKSPKTFNDYIYIKDLVNALIKVTKINKSNIVNLCNSKPISNLEFVKKFEKVNQRVIKKSIFEQKKKEINYGSNRKLLDLKWKSKYSLEAAFKDICSQ